VEVSLLKARVRRFDTISNNQRGESMFKLPISVIARVLLCVNAFAQSVSTKLDHVVIAVHDLEAAKRLYSGLGFSMLEGGRHPTGTENSAAPLSGGYLELIRRAMRACRMASRWRNILRKATAP
jgi:hypothetical protein